MHLLALPFNGTAFQVLTQSWAHSPARKPTKALIYFPNTRHYEIPKSCAINKCKKFKPCSTTARAMFMLLLCWVQITCCRCVWKKVNFEAWIRRQRCGGLLAAPLDDRVLVRCHFRYRLTGFPSTSHVMQHRMQVSLLVIPSSNWLVGVKTKQWPKPAQVCGKRPDSFATQKLNKTDLHGRFSLW